MFLNKCKTNSSFYFNVLPNKVKVSFLGGTPVFDLICKTHTYAFEKKRCACVCEQMCVCVCVRERERDYEEAKNKSDQKIINVVKTSFEIFYDFISSLIFLFCMKQTMEEKDVKLLKRKKILFDVFLKCFRVCVFHIIIYG